MAASMVTDIIFLICLICACWNINVALREPNVSDDQHDFLWVDWLAAAIFVVAASSLEYGHMVVVSVMAPFIFMASIYFLHKIYRLCLSSLIQLV